MSLVILCGCLPSVLQPTDQAVPRFSLIDPKSSWPMSHLLGNVHNLIKADTTVVFNCYKKTGAQLVLQGKLSKVFRKQPRFCLKLILFALLWAWKFQPTISDLYHSPLTSHKPLQLPTSSKPIVWSLIILPIFRMCQKRLQWWNSSSAFLQFWSEGAGICCRQDSP